MRAAISYLYVLFRKNFRYSNEARARIILEQVASPTACSWKCGSCDARCSDVAVHGCILRPGVSLRQGLPEAEVTHANRHHHRRCLDSVRPAVWLPDHHPALPGEVLAMSVNGWLQFAVFSLILLASVRPVGIYLARVLEGERTWLTPVLRPIERLIYKLCGIKAEQEMNWREYAYALLGFSAVTLLLTYGLERLQNFFPWNPQNLAAVGPDLAWNTAASFTTNTNWQSYVPENTMSYLTQMAGLATHNFWSAAMGIVVAVALIRGIKRTASGTIGNFWVDMTRTLLYVLLPASLIYALLLIAQGVPQNLKAYTQAHTLEQPTQTQTIAQGPVASQEVIKEMGTNGGGFFNANSAHPFENPTPLSNLYEMFLIFSIGGGLTYTLGRMTGSPGHGWAGLAAMFVLFAVGFTTVYWAESHPHLLIHGAAQTGTATAPAGNMEGKEVRNGIAASSLFSNVTTDASCGAVNTMHDSLTPLGGMMVTAPQLAS